LPSLPKRAAAQVVSCPLTPIIVVVQANNAPSPCRDSVSGPTGDKGGTREASSLSDGKGTGWRIRGSGHKGREEERKGLRQQTENGQRKHGERLRQYITRGSVVSGRSGSRCGARAMQLALVALRS
jgi:hypothetical protein